MSSSKPDEYVTFKTSRALYVIKGQAVFERTPSGDVGLFNFSLLGHGANIAQQATVIFEAGFLAGMGEGRARAFRAIDRLKWSDAT